MIGGMNQQRGFLATTSQALRHHQSSGLLCSFSYSFAIMDPQGESCTTLPPTRSLQETPPRGGPAVAALAMRSPCNGPLLQHAALATRSSCNAPRLRRAALAPHCSCNVQLLQRAALATRTSCNAQLLQRAALAACRRCTAFASPSFEFLER